MSFFRLISLIPRVILGATLGMVCLLSACAPELASESSSKADASFLLMANAKKVQAFEDFETPRKFDELPALRVERHSDALFLKSDDPGSFPFKEDPGSLPFVLSMSREMNELLAQRPDEHRPMPRLAFRILTIRHIPFESASDFALPTPRSKDASNSAAKHGEPERSQRGAYYLFMQAYLEPETTVDCVGQEYKARLSAAQQAFLCDGHPAYLGVQIVNFSAQDGKRTLFYDAVSPMSFRPFVVLPEEGESGGRGTPHDLGCADSYDCEVGLVKTPGTPLIGHLINHDWLAEQAASDARYAPVPSGMRDGSRLAWEVAQYAFLPRAGTTNKPPSDLNALTAPFYRPEATPEHKVFHPLTQRPPSLCQLVNTKTWYTPGPSNAGLTVDVSALAMALRYTCRQDDEQDCDTLETRTIEQEHSLFAADSSAMTALLPLPNGEGTESRLVSTLHVDRRKGRVDLYCTSASLPTGHQDRRDMLQGCFPSAAGGCAANYHVFSGTSLGGSVAFRQLGREEIARLE